MTSAGLSGFAKGFANGFINERNRRLDEEKDTNQLSLRYRLEDLSKQKADWQKKSEQEQEYIDGGKFVSKQIGDPQFASVAAQYLKNGYSQQDVISMYSKGNFKKNAPAEQTVKVDNPDLPSNRMSMNLPVGVDPNAPADVPPNTAIAEMNPVTTANTAAQDNTVANKVPLAANMVDPSAKPATAPDTSQLDAVDTQARKVAPGLFDYQTKNPETVLKDDPSGYQFVPDKKEVTVGTYSTEKYKYDVAVQNNDKSAIADQKLKLDAIEQGEMMKAKADAQAKGVPSQFVAVLDKNGNYLKTLLSERGPDGAPLNAVTHQPITLGPGMAVAPIDDKLNNEIRDIQKEWRKPNAEYEISAESTAEAFELGNKMNTLLDKPGNEALVTSSAGVLSMANDAFTEIKSIQQMIANQSTAAQKAASDGNPENLSASISQMEQSMITLEQKAAKLPNSVLSDKNAQLALDKTLYDNYTKLFAYKLAQANGQSGNAQSNKDIDNFMSIIGNKTANAAAVKASVSQILQMQKTKIDQKRSALDANFIDAGQTLGFNLNLKGRRMGDIIQDPNTRNYFNTIDQQAARNSQYTQQKFDEATNPQAQQTAEQPDKFGMVVGKVYPGADGNFKYLGGGKNPKNFQKVE